MENNARCPSNHKSTSPGSWRFHISGAPQPALALKVHSNIMPNSGTSNRRFSFMSKEVTPYTTLLIQNRQRRQTQEEVTTFKTAAKLENSLETNICVPSVPINNVEKEETESGHSQSDADAKTSENLEGLIDKELTLLEMIQLSKRQPDLDQMELDGRDDTMNYYSATSSEHDTCIHGLALGGSRRGRSLSRASTRAADLDIRSVLAFANSIPTKTKIILGAPTTEEEPAAAPPRFSLRRSVCPVCSVRWRDRTAIENVKSSGLRRNGKTRTSVIAPARLQTSIKAAYYPRPIIPALDVTTTSTLSGNRSSKSLFNRARLRGSPADVRVCAMRRTAAAHDAKYIFKANEAAHQRAHMFLSAHPEKAEV